MDILRSPFFYVGDKYKLMPQLNKLFPQEIKTYYEPFCGGGSSFLNTKAERYIVNDINFYIFKLHKLFKQNAKKEESFVNILFDLIKKYGLSCSYIGINVPEELKKKYVKTYYAKYNKEAYKKMRDDFNINQANFYLLYLLLIYGFNHMIRFNSQGLFNLPVGNVDYNNNVAKAIKSYLNFLALNNVILKNFDYKIFLKKQSFEEKDFVFCDPPYLISQSEYNKIWNTEEEKKLYEILDDLDKRNIKFGLTNLAYHKGNKNEILLKWSEKYNCFSVNSNYISFNDNTIKKDSKEIYVTNV